MAPPSFFDPLMFSTEIFFTVLAVVFCFAIYCRTKESYELTKYEGIGYFRDAFLFFGLSYVMRFLFSLMLFSRFAFDFIVPRGLFAPLFILPMGYFSTVGLFYLVFSLGVWKRFNSRSLLISGHGLAFLLSVVSFLARSHLIMLYLQSLLLVIAVMFAFFVHKEGTKLSQMKILYLLVFVLWFINLWILDRMRPFSFEIELFSYAVSLMVFIAIYHRVSKWVK